MGSLNTSMSGRTLRSVIKPDTWVTESNRRALSSLPRLPCVDNKYYVHEQLTAELGVQEIPAPMYLGEWIIYK